MATLVEVVCPEGVGEGDIIQVEHCGQSFDVPLPAGVAEGCAFQVELPEVELPEPPPDMSGLSMDAPAEPAEFHAETETETEKEKEKAKIKFIEDALAAGRLTSDQAALLQYLMESLYDFDALDDFIDAHTRQFEHYEKDGEQHLEWTMTHQRYVTMVEGHIADELEDLGGNAAGLNAILAEAFEGDDRAGSFLSRLLGMGDYDLFCRLMRAGGGSLKVSLQDLERLGGTYSALGGEDEDEDEDEE